MEINNFASDINTVDNSNFCKLLYLTIGLNGHELNLKQQDDL